MQQVEEARCHQPQVENMEHSINHIWMINNNEDTDDEMVIDDYLIQNIEREEVIESPEVQTIRRGREVLKKQGVEEAELPSIKVNQMGTYVMLAGPGENDSYTWKAQKIDTLEGYGVPALQQSVSQ